MVDLTYHKHNAGFNMKLLYVKICPFYKKHPDLYEPACKVGITGHPEIRLGVYQNSYSHLNHTATFDYVWAGDTRNINNIEKTLKTQLDMSIEKDGRGHSEWITGSIGMVLDQINDTIEGYRYNVTPIGEEISIDNLNKLDLGVDKT